MFSAVSRRHLQQASHPLYLLDMFTVLIPALGTKVHPSLIAAVRCLIEENFGVVLA
jgi:hypothetical protein